MIAMIPDINRFFTNHFFEGVTPLHLRESVDT